MCGIIFSFHRRTQENWSTVSPFDDAGGRKISKKKNIWYLGFISGADGSAGYNSHCNNKIGTRHLPEICYPDFQGVDKNMLLAR